MTFKNFVCWNQDMIRRVMNVEATQSSNHLFLATHHPISMYRQDSIRSSSQHEYDEAQFLQDFLAEKDFAFVPVLGETGTGKSHLIRWLSANIQSSALVGTRCRMARMDSLTLQSYCRSSIVRCLRSVVSPL